MTSAVAAVPCVLWVVAVFQHGQWKGDSYATEKSARFYEKYWHERGFSVRVFCLGDNLVEATKP